MWRSVKYWELQIYMLVIERLAQRVGKSLNYVMRYSSSANRLAEFQQGAEIFVGFCQPKFLFFQLELNLNFFRLLLVGRQRNSFAMPLVSNQRCRSTECLFVKRRKLKESHVCQISFPFVIGHTMSQIWDVKWMFHRPQLKSFVELIRALCKIFGQNRVIRGRWEQEWEGGGRGGRYAYNTTF